MTRTKLAAYGGVLLLIAGLGRVLPLSDAAHHHQRLTGMSSTTSATTSSRTSSGCRCRSSMQNRTGDLMSRATNDLSSVRMMVGPAVMYLANTLITAVVSLSLMFSLDVRLDADRADPAADRVDHGQDVRHGHSQDVRGGAGEAVGHERGRAGIAHRRARRARLPARSRPRSSGSGASNLDYLARNRRLSRLQGAFFPTMSLFLGVSALLALWLGSRDVVSGRITRRRARRLQRVPRAARVADDCLRLGHEPAGARHGVVEADADGDGDGAGGAGRDGRRAWASGSGADGTPPITGAIEFQKSQLSRTATARC